MQQVHITESAMEKISDLLAEENNPKLKLRTLYKVVVVQDLVMALRLMKKLTKMTL